MKATNTLPRLRRRERLRRAGRQERPQPRTREGPRLPHLGIDRDALTLGTGKLAVDGVLSSANTATTLQREGTKTLSALEFFQKIVAVFEVRDDRARVLRQAPQLRSQESGGDSRDRPKMQFPLMAGSSLPVTWRQPELGIKVGTKIILNRLVVADELEIYGIHAARSAAVHGRAAVPQRQPRAGRARRQSRHLPPERRGLRQATTDCGRGTLGTRGSAAACRGTPATSRPTASSFPRPITWGNFVKEPDCIPDRVSRRL